MNRRKLFLWLAAASGYIGTGILLGYSFSDHTTTTALWVGGLLVLAAALLLGMYISAKNEQTGTVTSSTSADRDNT